MEIQGRQLVHDDAHRDVLALSGIYPCDQPVQDKGVQRTDDALHLRVVGNEQVARMIRVAHLQIEIIAVLMEYPIGFFGGQTGGIDTQRAYHTLQLFHRLVLEGGLEWAEQRGHFVVGFQHLEDGLVALVQERQDMRHVAVLAQPVGGLHDIPVFAVTDDTRRFP